MKTCVFPRVENSPTTHKDQRSNTGERTKTLGVQYSIWQKEAEDPLVKDSRLILIPHKTKVNRQRPTVIGKTFYNDDSRFKGTRPTLKAIAAMSKVQTRRKFLLSPKLQVPHSRVLVL
jgi:hypothetical protein